MSPWIVILFPEALNQQSLCKMAEITLEDKYAKTEGRIFLSGIQALVRLPLIQKRRDTAAGLNTAGFISGYRGSPLAGYDIALQRASEQLKSHDIHFQPGVNEDLAATAIWGTQQLHLSPGATRDGVFGIWYAKGPGVDRSLDALHHANAGGTHPHGGVLCLTGDDHSCKSSSLSHQSDQSYAAAGIPILYPSNVQEFVEYGILGIAMSRYSGCWVALKVTSETVESTATMDLASEMRDLIIPEDFIMTDDGVNIRWPDAFLEKDRRLQRYKLPAALAYARANKIDQLVWDSPNPRFGIFASGKSYQDVRQALLALEIDQSKAREFGLRLYKVGMPWPLEPTGAVQFSDGLEEILVVEEKKGFVEDQLKSHLYNSNLSQRPYVVGKKDETGKWLLPADQELSVDLIAIVIAERLLKFLDYQPLHARLEYLGTKQEQMTRLDKTVNRTPYFCSGCPHNTSTKIPEGSIAYAGIGCHFMSQKMDRSTQTYTHMGAEGATWIGQSPFTSTKHIFVNLGDGTYQHSGLLAIRAAVAADVTVTYKILFNDAVAMTGAQAIEGGLTVEAIAAQVKAEGIVKIAIVSDQPSRFQQKNLPDDTSVYDRSQMPEVQREMRQITGCTVIIYDQACAAMLRRKRNRGQVRQPPAKVMINAEVCEGCGDCSVQSNCISIEPLETDFGRKRVINQSSCNFDLSCVEGFCPSFVTVLGAKNRKAVIAFTDQSGDLPEPVLNELRKPYNILISGVGGTGVLTVGALIGMAAHLEGIDCAMSDITGLAQKGGAVLSHVRIGPDSDQLHSPRLMAGAAHLILACDYVVAASAEALNTMDSERTAAIINTCVTPVSDFVLHNDMNFHEKVALDNIQKNTRHDGTHLVPATDFITASAGTAVTVNVFMLGYAFQKGLLPMKIASLREAIRLNSVAVEENLAALEWGRRVAHDQARLLAEMKGDAALTGNESITLDQIIALKAKHLANYQNAGYARKYKAFVDRIRQEESQQGFDLLGLTRAVAINYAKLLAYKDEYEVARLYSNGRFITKLHSLFEGNFRFRLHLAAPTISGTGTGGKRPEKRSFGQWIIPIFRLLAKFKILRGTALDPFGYSKERKLERELITDYERLVSQLRENLSQDNYQTAVALASLPDNIRGFGPVKELAVQRAKTAERELLLSFRQADSIDAASVG